jgi:hypothetical protein
MQAHPRPQFLFPRRQQPTPAHFACVTAPPGRADSSRCCTLGPPPRSAACVLHQPSPAADGLFPPPVPKGAPARVVALTSYGHNFCKALPLDDLNWERRPYSAWPSYGQSKLSNALFARELARR